MIRDGIVHVVNGDSTAGTLEESDLPGEIRVWADALDTGPVLPGDDETFRAARARWWSSLGNGGDEAKIIAQHAEWDAAVDAGADSADEVVLWYEHDLFDQLALVRLLARIGRRPRKAQITMVSIDRHPEIPDFKGLGQLEAHQLAALWPRRTPIARDAFDEAAAAWVAITAPEPRAIGFIAKRIKTLPFLAPALERQLEELPDTGTGLTRTERQVLGAVARGTDNAAGLMAELHTIDPRYLVTDVNITQTLRTLAAIELLALPDGPTGIAVTEAGREVLAGKRDRITTAGIDSWRGGVRLLGKGPVWRWDQAERRAVLR